MAQCRRSNRQIYSGATPFWFADSDWLCPQRLLSLLCCICRCSQCGEEKYRQCKDVFVYLMCGNSSTVTHCCFLHCTVLQASFTLSTVVFVGVYYTGSASDVTLVQASVAFVGVYKQCGQLSLFCSAYHLPDSQSFFKPTFLQQKLFLRASNIW